MKILLNGIRLIIKFEMKKSRKLNNIIVTGGMGFIGIVFCKTLLKKDHNIKLHIVDIQTYASNLNAFNSKELERIEIYKNDINETDFISNLLSDTQIDAIYNFAAESHVDNSIKDPSPFIHSNINGTFSLLEAARAYIESSNKKDFYFHHISTDEVFGDLKSDDPKFNEKNIYKPSSPYSASKAASDHLVRAWNRTFNINYIITNCSNNYGPYQNEEKFIPKIIRSIEKQQKIPIYGSGTQIRDWLYVEDHAEALIHIMYSGVLNKTFCIGGNNEIKNIDIVHRICDEMSKLGYSKTFDLIEHVDDRPGHDLRYAIDTKKIECELGWKNKYNFSEGLKKTLNWYL